MIDGKSSARDKSMINTTRDWLSIAGQFGVIASLVFVGWQIKLDNDIAKSATYQARSALAAEYYWTIATDPVSRSAVTKMFTKDSELTDDEIVAATWLWASGKEIMQNSYYQYQNGYLDEEHWAQIRRLIKRTLKNPIAHSVFQDGNTRQSFQEELDRIEAELSAEAEAMVQ